MHAWGSAPGRPGTQEWRCDQVRAIVFAFDPPLRRSCGAQLCCTAGCKGSAGCSAITKWFRVTVRHRGGRQPAGHGATRRRAVRLRRSRLWLHHAPPLATELAAARSVRARVDRCRIAHVVPIPDANPAHDLRILAERRWNALLTYGQARAAAESRLTVDCAVNFGLIAGRLADELHQKRSVKTTPAAQEMATVVNRFTEVHRHRELGLAANTAFHARWRPRLRRHGAAPRAAGATSRLRVRSAHAAVPSIACLPG